MLFKNYILKINKNKYYFNHIIIKVIFINYFFWFICFSLRLFIQFIIIFIIFNNFKK